MKWTKKLKKHKGKTKTVFIPEKGVTITETDVLWKLEEAKEKMKRTRGS